MKDLVNYFSNKADYLHAILYPFRITSQKKKQAHETVLKLVTSLSFKVPKSPKRHHQHSRNLNIIKKSHDFYILLTVIPTYRVQNSDILKVISWLLFFLVGLHLNNPSTTSCVIIDFASAWDCFLLKKRLAAGEMQCDDLAESQTVVSRACLPLCTWSPR